MELLIGVLAIAAVAGGLWWWRRSRPAPVEDTWVLPSAEEVPLEFLGGSAPAKDQPERPDYLKRAVADELAGSGLGAAGLGGASLGGQMLNRDMLVNRDRTFDPANWDNTPDADTDPS